MKVEGERDLSVVAKRLASILSKMGRLNRIRLDSRCVTGRYTTEPHPGGFPSTEACLSASWTFKAAALAMAKRTVSIGALSVFRGTMWCSVQAADITRHMEKLWANDTDFAAAAKKIKKLGLSVAARTRDIKIASGSGSDVSNSSDDDGGEKDEYSYSYVKTEGRDEDGNPRSEHHFTGVAAMLKQLPNLALLELHECTILSTGARASDRLFANMAHGVMLPALEHLIIRGLHVKKADMLLFLPKHPRIKRLKLRSISLTPGTWAPILAYLGTMPALRSLRLSALRSGRGNYINLNPTANRFRDRITSLQKRVQMCGRLACARDRSGGTAQGTQVQAASRDTLGLVPEG
ncbi:hypothetical protein ACO1O0_003899 [Amphichorda felina]